MLCVSFDFDTGHCGNNRKKERYGAVVEPKGIFVALAILYRAAVIYIGPTPALLTPTISKQ